MTDLLTIKGNLEVIAYKIIDGKKVIIHYEEGENFVTPWAQHALIRLWAGRIFEKFGSTRKYTRIDENTTSPVENLEDKITYYCSKCAGDLADRNELWANPHFHPGDILIEKNNWQLPDSSSNDVYVYYWDETTGTRKKENIDSIYFNSFAGDGTLMSGEALAGLEQSTPEFKVAPMPYLYSKIMESSPGYLNTYAREDYLYSYMIYPEFPTKMLFGIGPRLTYDGEYRESPIWFDKNQDYLDNILPKTNEDVRGLMQSDYIFPHDHPCFVEGEVRTSYSTTNEGDTPSDYDDAYWKHSGLGASLNRRFDYKLVKPSFIYITREVDFSYLQDLLPPILIHNDEYNLENKTKVGTRNDGMSPEGNYSISNLGDKITFKVVLPITEEDWQHPYNGYTLKVAGIYNDAKFLTDDTSVQDTYYDSLIDSSREDIDRETFYKMNPFSMIYGQLLAKKYITPVPKSKDIGVEFRWSFYFGSVEKEGGSPWISPS